MNASADAAEARRLAWWRWSAFALGCGAFFLSFFHRVSTGAIAADLQHEFAIGAAALGTLGATYFYIYALMQVPAGVLADTLGPRVTLTAGMLIAGIGSVAYGMADNFTTAAVARTLVGLGVSGVFVCTLKLHANWFQERRFATATGASNVSGILGALAATAPLAWLVTAVSWRVVANIGGFAASGILQPLVGWVVDHGAGVVAGGSADAYRLGIGVLAAWLIIGIAAAMRLTETRCRNVWSERQATRC